MCNICFQTQILISKTEFCFQNGNEKNLKISN